MLSLFISSTIKDLYFVRQTLANQIEAHLGHRLKMSESILFDWTQEDILASCLHEVEKAHVYVLIIGNQTGTLLSDQGISMTRAEYRQAQAHHKPMMVLIMQKTWILYEQAKDKLPTAMAEFISEVVRHLGRNVCRFATSEEAFAYVRAQLSNLLGNYVELNRSVTDIRRAIRKAEACQGFYRFALTLFQHERDYGRILSVISQVMEAGDICDQDVVPQPIVRLSKVSGATLYRLVARRHELVLQGCAGDADCCPAYRLDDEESYITLTRKCRQSKLLAKETDFGQKEKIVCLPMADQFVLTLHFLVEFEYRHSIDQQVILDQICDRNKTLLHTFYLFLERSEKEDE